MDNKIKNVICTSEGGIVIVELHNNKKLKRAIKRNVNDNSKYFLFEKSEYYIDELFTKGICLIK